MSNPEPIETRYHGCRFRSRLEARWAVFFDRLGVRWEYEPQGYRLGSNGKPYLPDFVLPDLNTFVEVKGDPKKLDLGLLAAATETRTEQCFVLVLGPVPTYDSSEGVPTHSLLTPLFDLRYSGSPWSDEPPLQDFEELFKAGQDNDAIRRVWAFVNRHPVVVQRSAFLMGQQPVVMPVAMPDLAPTAERVLNPDPVWWVVPQPAVKAAYDAARSARFEHGESG